MIKIWNKILYYTKTIILLICFSLVLYIAFSINSYYGYGLWYLFRIFMPLLLVLIVFVVSFFFNSGQDETIFNLGCVLALIAISIIALRSILDTNMVVWIRGKMNFYFFENQLLQIKILCYLMFLGNLLIIYKEKRKTQI